MKLSKWMFAALLAVPTIASPAFADDPKSDQAQQSDQMQQTVKLGDLPSAVKSTVQDEAKGKKISSITKSTENGKTVYQVSLQAANGKMQDIKISDTGKVIERMPAHGQKSDVDQTMPQGQPSTPPSAGTPPSQQPQQ